MFHDNIIINCLISFALILLGLMITVDLVVHALNSERHEDEDREPFLDKEGNHTYYERSLIEKQEFAHQNPDIPPQQLRTFRRFFHHLLHP